FGTGYIGTPTAANSEQNTLVFQLQDKRCVTCVKVLAFV
uniref:Uncharacterized protein n=1 Tax=Anopheles quadriannulatus TaxID=34691 RepID=A0A182XRY0_ANOQN